MTAVCEDESWVGEEATFMGGSYVVRRRQGCRSFTEKEDFGEENALVRGDPSWPPFHEG